MWMLKEIRSFFEPETTRFTQITDGVRNVPNSNFFSYVRWNNCWQSPGSRCYKFSYNFNCHTKKVGIWNISFVICNLGRKLISCVNLVHATENTYFHFLSLRYFYSRNARKRYHISRHFATYFCHYAWTQCSLSVGVVWCRMWFVLSLCKPFFELCRP